jgi:hypothetical protein
MSLFSRQGQWCELFLCHHIQAGSGAQPPIEWVLRALILRVKLPVREGDHSPPSSAEVKNAWSYTSTPLLRLHGVVLSYA